ncbi:hypothetical protein [Streptomyces sp. SID1046]
MNRDEALVLIKEVLTDVVPGADAAALAPDENFRDNLEMTRWTSSTSSRH